MASDPLLSAISWSPGYETGIASIDSEHRVLVTLYNDLLHAIARRTSLDLRRECLASIRDWAALHFRNEERMIHGVLAAEHVAAHRGFVDGLALLYAQAADDHALHDAAHVLRLWLIDHFLDDQILFNRLRRQAQPAP
ncbi:MAG TPA: hemerythrin domain-containing protein [Azospirillum sp.]